MDSTYDELPAGAAEPPGGGAQMAVSVAFDIERGIRNGVHAIRRNFWVVLGGGLLKSCSEGGGSGGNSVSPDDIETLKKLADGSFDPSRISLGSNMGPPVGPWIADELPFDPAILFGGLGMGLMVAVVALVVVLVLLILALNAWITPGWIRLHQEILRDGTGRFGTLFGAGDVFLRSLGWGLLSGLLGLATIVIAALPLGALFFVDEPSMMLLVGAACGLWAVGVVVASIWMRLCLAFVPHIIALEGQGIMAAIDRSVALTRGGRAWLLLYMALLSFLGLLATLPGYCLCCVGVLITRPLGVMLRDFGYTEGFLRLTRPPTEVAGWASERWED
ncbi:MAG: hypothetical protein EXR71_12240 [Myxococcales bacterium]|nr:hypothetical protein [Myxococcales bacterium]